ncbi:hypothetical protein [Kitasatospora sp. NBC_01300]|uniref:hypothetical protein n=1 Tax=Kitasatospora sp. NBC_01300 TaxID=2903574 RepID=UPI002F916BE0|nr:hypothetical protein OG556_38375 [Kitasatospora sp. NBC_01300]
MSKTARLLATAAVTVALSGILAPAASATAATTAPAGIGWDGTTVAPPVVAGGAGDGIGWDGTTTVPPVVAGPSAGGIGWD